MWVAACGVFLAAAAALLGWDAMWTPAESRAAANRLEAAFIRAKAAGVPMELSDLDPHPPVNPVSNAGPVVRQMMALRPSPGKLTSRLMDAVEAGNWPMAGRELARISAFMDLVDKAKGMPCMHLDLDWMKGMSLTLHEFETLRDAANGLSARARMRARQGDWEDALSDLQGCQNLAQLSGQEPILLSAVTEVIIRGAASTLARALAEEWQANPAALAKLKGSFAAAPPPSLRFALRGEAVITINVVQACGDTFRSSSSPVGKLMPEGLDIFATKLKRDSWPKGPRGRGALARMLEVWAEVFEGFGKPSSDERAGRQALERVQNQLNAETRPSFELAIILIPETRQIVDRFARVVVMERLTLAFIAAVEYKAVHGRFPKTLNEIGVETRDPVTGEQFGYRRTKEGFRIWSAGPGRTEKSMPLESEVDPGGADSPPNLQGEIILAFPSKGAASANRVSRP